MNSNAVQDETSVRCAAAPGDEEEKNASNNFKEWNWNHTRGFDGPPRRSRFWLFPHGVAYRVKGTGQMREFEDKILKNVRPARDNLNENSLEVVEVVSETVTG